MTLRAVLQVKTMPQAVRDRVGSNLLLLTLKELFEWRFMQTGQSCTAALPSLHLLAVLQSGQAGYRAHPRVYHLAGTRSSRLLKETEHIPPNQGFVHEDASHVTSWVAMSQRCLLSKVARLGLLGAMGINKG